MFSCPSAGLKFASGIHTDERSLALVGQMPVTLRCPLCGKTHRVTAKSGSFEDAAAAPPNRRKLAKKAQASRFRDGRAWFQAKETGA
jgi:hypothetical protein